MLLFLLIFLATLIPGVDAFMKEHTWPGWTILIFSAGAGWFAGEARAITVRDEIERMDDDTLKFRHDKMSRLKQKSSIALYLGLVLVAAYWVFLR